MIYLDTSVAMSEIMTEARRPTAEFWLQEFVASELLRYEVWNRLHAYGVGRYRHHRARNVLRGVTFMAMSADVLVRALRPYRVPVRTLDGLHLATADWLRAQGVSIELASYDSRLLAAAATIKIPVAAL